MPDPSSGAPEWDGAAYARVNGLQEALAARALGAVELRGDERVLDVGCGDGRVTLALADRLTTGTVLGVDPSASMLAVARDRAAGRDDVAFADGRAEDLDPGARFDVVVSFNALHWATDPARALARVAAAVAPGGTLLLQLVGEGARPSLEDTAAAVLATPGWSGRAAGAGPRFWHPGPGAVAAALRGHGLQVRSDVVADESWDFGDRGTFAAWCAVGLAAWLADPADGPAFAADVLDAYAPVSGSASLFRFLQCRVVAHRPG